MVKWSELFFLNQGWKIDRRLCVPDDIDKIEEVLLKWSDEEKLQARLFVVQLSPGTVLFTFFIRKERLDFPDWPIFHSKNRQGCSFWHQLG